MPEQTIRPPETDGRSRIPTEGQAVRNGDAPQPSLATVLDEVRAQGASTRRIQQGFAFFAVLALVLALTNLVVIAAKLGDKTTTTRVVTAAAAAPATSGAAKAATSPALGHNVGVQLAEFTVKPAPAKAAAGKVTFDVRNGGKATHEFVVVRTDKPAGGLLKGAEADESGNVGELGDLKPGQAKKLTLNLGKGHYALLCNLPGHYKAGQHADFTVQ